VRTGGRNREFRPELESVFFESNQPTDVSKSGHQSKPVCTITISRRGEPRMLHSPELVIFHSA
jgi:hypothetical protein